MPRKTLHGFVTPLVIAAALLPQSCSHQPSHIPAIESVDRAFIADAIRLNDLDNTVTDIKTRHATGDITILVRYFLQPPYTGSKELAYAQGITVRNYLLEQQITVPIDVIVSPTDHPANTIWISYQVDKNKGNGVYMSPPDIDPIKP